jgi:ketosteroid isomerase-like protein
MIGALVAKKALAHAFDALNRHDLPKFMSAWRDDGTFVYPGEIPESGTFQGKLIFSAPTQSLCIGISNSPTEREGQAKTAA